MNFFHEVTWQRLIKGVSNAGWPYMSSTSICSELLSSLSEDVQLWTTTGRVQQGGQQSGCRRHSVHAPAAVVIAQGWRPGLP